eukprot:2632820-Rhodomonas_salina.2
MTTFTRLYFTVLCVCCQVSRKDAEPGGTSACTGVRCGTGWSGADGGLLRLVREAYTEGGPAVCASHGEPTLTWQSVAEASFEFWSKSAPASACRSAFPEVCTWSPSAPCAMAACACPSSRRISSPAHSGEASVSSGAAGSGSTPAADVLHVAPGPRVEELPSCGTLFSKLLIVSSWSRSFASTAAIASRSSAARSESECCDSSRATRQLSRMVVYAEGPCRSGRCKGPGASRWWWYGTSAPPQSEPLRALQPSAQLPHAELHPCVASAYRALPAHPLAVGDGHLVDARDQQRIAASAPRTKLLRCRCAAASSRPPGSSSAVAPRTRTGSSRRCWCRTNPDRHSRTPGSLGRSRPHTRRHPARTAWGCQRTRSRPRGPRCSGPMRQALG